MSSFGVAGIGKAGRFLIEILEWVDATSAHLLSIETPDWYFCFTLPGIDACAKASSFIQEQTGRLVWTELVVGSFSGAPVLLVKDDEYPDRFYIRASADGELLEFPLAGDVLAEFTDALGQAIRDLNG